MGQGEKSQKNMKWKNVNSVAQCRVCVDRYWNGGVLATWCS